MNKEILQQILVAFHAKNILDNINQYLETHSNIDKQEIIDIINNGDDIDMATE